MAATGVQYASASLATERNRPGRSPNIWKNFTWLRSLEEAGIGQAIFENFMCWGGTAIVSNSGNYMGDGASWHSFEATGSTLKESFIDAPNGGIPLVNQGLGVVRFLLAATAHTNIALELGATGNTVGASVGGPFGVGSNAALTVPTAGSLPKLFFEARVRFSQAAANTQSMFIGVANPNKTSGANTVFNASQVLQNMDHIGFYIDGVTGPVITNATSAKIAATYGVAASAPVQVGSFGGIPSTATYPGATQVPATAGLLGTTQATSDWTKLGFVFDPADVQPLKYFQDGVLLGSQTLNQITAASWPSNLPLTALLYFQAVGTIQPAFDVDWVAIGQMINQE